MAPMAPMAPMVTGRPPGRSWATTKPRGANRSRSPHSRSEGMSLHTGVAHVAKPSNYEQLRGQHELNGDRRCSTGAPEGGGIALEADFDIAANRMQRLVRSGLRKRFLLKRDALIERLHLESKLLSELVRMALLVTLLVCLIAVMRTHMLEPEKGLLVRAHVVYCACCDVHACVLVCLTCCDALCMRKCCDTLQACACAGKADMHA